MKARQIVEGFITGLHKSPFYGFSVEFAEHRPYNAGDDLRHVDWKVVGKTERYYVKQYEEETNLRCTVVLDTSTSMDFKHFGSLTKRQYGAQLGAAMLYLMHRQRDACGLATFDEVLNGIIPAKSSYRHLRYLFEQLQPHTESQPKGAKRKTSAAVALHQLAEQIHRRSLVVVITDLFDDPAQQSALLESLKHLRYRHHEVILFHLMEARSERLFDFADGRLMMEDLETGQTLDVIPSDIRDSYRREVEAYTAEFKRTCQEAHIDYEAIDTEGDFTLALLAFLTKRKRMM
jgi:uncharacterized protein (DUF58 family)